MTSWYAKTGNDAVFAKEDLKDYGLAIKQLVEEYQRLYTKIQ